MRMEIEYFLTKRIALLKEMLERLPDDSEFNRGVRSAYKDELFVYESILDKYKIESEEEYEPVYIGNGVYEKRPKVKSLQIENDFVCKNIPPSWYGCRKCDYYYNIDRSRCIKQEIKEWALYHVARTESEVKK